MKTRVCSDAVVQPHAAFFTFDLEQNQSRGCCDAVTEFTRHCRPEVRSVCPAEFCLNRRQMILFLFIRFSFISSNQFAFFLLVL